MKQQTLAMAADPSDGFERCRRPARRDEALGTMDRIVPWAALCAVIEPAAASALRPQPCVVQALPH